MWIANPITGQSVRVNTLADDCANHVVLDLAVAKEMGFAGPMKKYRVTGCGGYEKVYSAMTVHVGLVGQDGQNLVKTNF